MCAKLIVRPAGFEPTTYGLGNTIWGFVTPVLPMHKKARFSVLPVSTKFAPGFLSVSIAAQSLHKFFWGESSISKYLALVSLTVRQCSSSANQSGTAVTRKRYTAEEKIRTVLEPIRGDEPVSAICRRAHNRRETPTEAWKEAVRYLLPTSESVVRDSIYRNSCLSSSLSSLYSSRRPEKATLPCLIE